MISNTTSHRYPERRYGGKVDFTPLGLEDARQSRAGNFIRSRLDLLKGSKARLGCFALGASLAVSGTIMSLAGQESPRVAYETKPGDTLWGIAQKIDANMDGIAGNEDPRVRVDEMTLYLEANGMPKGVAAKALPPQTTVMVPPAADIQPNLPGTQLDIEE